MKFSRFFLVLATTQLVSGLMSQTVDVSPFKQREKLVGDAQKIFSERGTEPIVAEKNENPFLEKPLPEAAGDSAMAGQGVDLPSGPLPIDQLIQAAIRIPATGTASLGGQFFLLTGQKKFKVGDRLIIDSEGLPYELVISSITPTSFTVKKGELSYTRAIRLQPNTSTPVSRP